MRSLLLASLAAISALLPWLAFFLALRAVRRRFAPRRIMRPRRLPVTKPGDPFGAMVLLVLLIALFVGWALFTRPLWQGYVLDAVDYRENASTVANEVSGQLMATGQPLSAARIGPGRFDYSLGPGNESTRATVSYYWRGAPELPGTPGDSVEGRRRDGPRGALVIVYRRNLTAEQLGPILAAFDRINLDPAAGPRRAAVDVPLLLRSARLYWSPDYAGYLDNPWGVARFLAGLPVLPPLYVAGLAIGLLPAR